MNRIETTLIEKNTIAENILELKYSVPVDFTFEPGQFVDIHVTPPYHRPYSIVSCKDGALTLLIDVSKPGKGADYFRDAEVGSKTRLIGPIGKFTMKDTTLPKVFIATGVGIAPFIPMIENIMTLANAQNMKTALYFGMRYVQNDALVSRYLKKFIDNHSLDFVRCITQPKDDALEHFHGRVTDFLRENFEHDPTQSEFYICGANEMVKEVQEILNEKGCDKVYVEKYG